MPEKIVRIADIEHLHWSLEEADVPASLSLDGRGLSLAAAVELASIKAHLDRASNGVTSSIHVANCPIWSVLGTSRWPVRRSCTKVRSGAVAALVLPSRANDVWWTQCLHNLLKELKVNGFPTYHARALTFAVAEMADNLWLHSDAPDHGLVAYQIHRRKFAFCVADTGIGILASLRKNPRYKYLNSSMDGIQHAIQPSVSRYDGGGMGFSSMLRALADLWGHVRLRSGEAALLIDRTRENRKMGYIYLPHLPGLHVAVRCSLDPPL